MDFDKDITTPPSYFLPPPSGVDSTKLNHTQ
jgi:hypothetical protein